MRKCNLCNSEVEFDDRLEEYVCLSCEYVNVRFDFDEMFELATTDEKPKSVGIALTNMMLADFGYYFQERVEEIYTKINTLGLFTSYTKDTRSVAVAEYIIKENNLPSPNLAKQYNVSIKNLIPIIESQFGKLKSNNRIQMQKIANRMQLGNEFVDECLDIFNKLELIMNERNMNRKPSHYASICYIVCKRHSLMGRRKVAKVLGVSGSSLYNEAKILEELI